MAVAEPIRTEIRTTTTQHEAARPMMQSLEHCVQTAAASAIPLGRCECSRRRTQRVNEDTVRMIPESRALRNLRRGTRLDLVSVPIPNTKQQRNRIMLAIRRAIEIKTGSIHRTTSISERPPLGRMPPTDSAAPRPKRSRNRTINRGRRRPITRTTTSCPITAREGSEPRTAPSASTSQETAASLRRRRRHRPPIRRTNRSISGRSAIE